MSRSQPVGLSASGAMALVLMRPQAVRTLLLVTLVASRCLGFTTNEPDWRYGGGSTGGGDDEFGGVAADASGDLYLAARLEGPYLSHELRTGATSEVIVMKTTSDDGPTSSITWSTALSSRGDVGAVAIAVDEERNRVVVVGSVTVGLDDVTYVGGSYNAFFVVLAADTGLIQERRVYASTVVAGGDEALTSLRIRPSDGAIFACGSRCRDSLSNPSDWGSPGVAQTTSCDAVFFSVLDLSPDSLSNPYVIPIGAAPEHSHCAGVELIEDSQSVVTVVSAGHQDGVEGTGSMIFQRRLAGQPYTLDWEIELSNEQAGPLPLGLTIDHESGWLFTCVHRPYINNGAGNDYQHSFVQVLGVSTSGSWRVVEDNVFQTDTSATGVDALTPAPTARCGDLVYVPGAGLVVAGRVNHKLGSYPQHDPLVDDFALALLDPTEQAQAATSKPVGVYPFLRATSSDGIDDVGVLSIAVDDSGYVYAAGASGTDRTRVGSTATPPGKDLYVFRVRARRGIPLWLLITLAVVGAALLSAAAYYGGLFRRRDKAERAGVTDEEDSQYNAGPYQTATDRASTPSLGERIRGMMARRKKKKSQQQQEQQQRRGSLGGVTVATQLSEQVSEYGRDDDEYGRSTQSVPSPPASPSKDLLPYEAPPPYQAAAAAAGRAGSGARAGSAHRRAGAGSKRAGAAGRARGNTAQASARRGTKTGPGGASPTRHARGNSEGRRGGGGGQAAVGEARRPTAEARGRGNSDGRRGPRAMAGQGSPDRRRPTVEGAVARGRGNSDGRRGRAPVPDNASPDRRRARAAAAGAGAAAAAAVPDDAGGSTPEEIADVPAVPAAGAANGDNEDGVGSRRPATGRQGRNMSAPGPRGPVFKHASSGRIVAQATVVKAESIDDYLPGV